MSARSTARGKKSASAGPEVVIGAASLTPADVTAVARYRVAIRVDPKTLERLGELRQAIDALSHSGQPVYGVSTGFGSLATTFIPPAQRRDLQRSLIRSHAAGMGPEIEDEVVRAMMVCRLRTLCSGVTGVRPQVAVALADLLNHRLTPLVPEFGSLGCSGDLAPLAHVALVLMGEGEVRDGAGRRRPAAAALSTEGLAPIELAEKEGLSLINGTDGMLGQLVLALADGDALLRAADVTASLSVQALRGTDRAYAADLQALRPHPGQAASARNLLRLLADSPLVHSHDGNHGRVQDAYSLRCVPQVHGAARDTFAHARTVATIELESAIDNPSIAPDGRLASNGNFHGAPLAYVCDFLAVVAADVASMAERRVDRLMDPTRNEGLPAFLAAQPGVDSGLMIAQYTAASIVSEMKRLAVPASVDSIPTSAMQEDHVSMGWQAARKLRRSLALLGDVLAIELASAVRALAFIDVAASPVAQQVVTSLGALGAHEHDRIVAPQLASAAAYLTDGRLEAAVTAIVGGLE